MKCVCGYEGEDFESLKLREISTWHDEEGDETENENGYSIVYVCPRCGTLKIKS